MLGPYIGRLRPKRKGSGRRKPVPKSAKTRIFGFRSWAAVGAFLWEKRPTEKSRMVSMVPWAQASNMGSSWSKGWGQCASPGFQNLDLFSSQGWPGWHHPCLTLRSFSLQKNHILRLSTCPRPCAKGLRSHSGRRLGVNAWSRWPNLPIQKGPNFGPC